MLLITGNVPTTQWNRGPFQESGRFFQGDFITVLRSYVKRSFQPTRGEMLPLAMRQAFALMTNGRPGPVHLDVPLNLFMEPVDEVAAWDPVGAAVEIDGGTDEPGRLIATVSPPCFVPPSLTSGATASEPGRWDGIVWAVG